jgi:long-chain fatty acid transport protein
VAFGLLEFGLASNTAIQETFGVRGAVGLTHDLGPVMVGLTYNSELTLDFDDVTETAPRVFNDIELEQPQEIVVGLSSTPSLWRNLLIEANVIWKNWDNASGYQDIWEDNYTFALGGQYTIDKWKLRLGYSYASDFKKDDVGNSLAGITTLNVPGLGVVPVTPPLVQFVQATLTQPYWQQQVSGGFGYALIDSIQLDVQAGYSFDGERTIGGTRLDVNEFQAGVGFTWSF